MIVCSHCQFKNPDANRFCQQCGGSLTDRNCPACGSLVQLDTLNCPTCDAAIGIVWRAVLMLNSPQQASPQPELVAQTSETADSAYLDRQERYRLLQPLLPLSEAEPETEVQVLDCQPFQPSLLEVLYTQQSEGISEKEAATVRIPPLAQRYLALQEQLYPSLPQLHDAWEDSEKSVILLEDRATLPLLIDLWSDEQILPIQVLHWLHELTDLWEVLQSFQCCRSLLELNNLRVDEDQLLCLQRLYFDQPNRSPDLTDLGALWQTLFAQSQRTQIGELSLLCAALQTGEVATIAELRSRFDAIIAGLQSSTAESSSSNSSMATPSDPKESEAVQAGTAAEDILTAVPPDAATTVLQAEAESPLLEVEAPDDDSIGEGDDLPTIVLPMKLLSLEDAGRTDVGQQREHNEDFFYIQAQSQKVESPQGRTLYAKGLYVLCDGMGGHASGEVASSLAVSTLKDFFQTRWDDRLPTEEVIREAIDLSNKTIYDLNQQNARSGSGRMGTTLVLLLVHNTDAVVAHVGDSRLYRYSSRRGLEQLTIDHEVGQREIQRGVEPAIAYARPDAFQLTQALGPRDEHFVNPEVRVFELNEDCLLLLCSDGLSDNDLLEQHTESHLEPLLHAQSIEQGTQGLIDLANQVNGHDNITAITIRVKVRPNLDQFKS